LEKNTASALYKSNYKIKKNHRIVDEGLLSFQRYFTVKRKNKERLSGMPAAENSLPTIPKFYNCKDKLYGRNKKKWGIKEKFEKRNINYIN
jgi:hypothetical protein